MVTAVVDDPALTVGKDTPTGTIAFAISKGIAKSPIKANSRNPSSCKSIHYSCMERDLGFLSPFLVDGIEGYGGINGIIFVGGMAP